MFYPGKLSLQSPSQLSPEARLNQSARGRPRINKLDTINRGLLQRLTFDASSRVGTSLADASGNGNVGTMVGSPPLVNGRMGGGISFDGSTQYVDVAAIGKPSSWSICFWIKPTSWGSASLVFSDSSPDSTSTYWGIFAQSGGAVQMYISNGTTFQGPNTSSNWDSATYPSTAWTHVVGTIDGSNFRYYRNGLLVGSPIGQTIQNTGTAQPIRIGAFPPGGVLYNGLMDDVWIINRALAPNEIVRMYNDITGNLGLNTWHWDMVGAAAAAASFVPYTPVTQLGPIQAQ